MKSIIWILDEIRNWYDGYSFEEVPSVYSPKSVVSCMRLGKLGNYWNQTETFEALQLYIDMNFEGLRDDILSMLAGEEVPVNTGSFTNDMTTFRTEDDVLTLVDPSWISGVSLFCKISIYSE